MLKLIEAIGAIVICQLAGIFGSFHAMPKIHGWYAKLRKPRFRPPNWVFGPVWVTLYSLMGVALFRIWDSPPTSERTFALILFLVQLLLNAAWPYLFFGLEEPGLAFKEIMALLFFAALTLVNFGHLDGLAGWLFAPYLAWVAFAAALNFQTARLNPK